MRNKVLPILLAFVLLAMGEMALGQEIYKWVDEKGVVHFTDNPTSGSLRGKKEQSSKENSAEILKKLEIGNRNIPRDMWIYGPGGEIARSRESDNAVSTPVRSGRS